MEKRKKTEKRLFKEKYFCQLCKKQCKDKNGFRCHQESASHKQNVRTYAENPQKFMIEYSQQFQKDFLNLLKLKGNNKPVNANTIYSEYIRDKSHVRLNSTKWPKFSDFLNDMKEKQLIQYQEDEIAGGFIFLYQEDKKQKIEDEKKKTKEEKERMIEEARYKKMEYQARLADQKLEENSDKLSYKFEIRKQNEKEEYDNIFEQPLIPVSRTSSKNQNLLGKRPQSRLSILREQLEGKKTENLKKLKVEKRPVRWLIKNIEVKIIDSEVGNGDYYKKKGRVSRVIDDFWAEIEIKKSGDLLQVHQDLLKTVVPKLGKMVKILKRGKFRREKGILEEYDTKKKFGLIELLNDNNRQKVELKYGEFCKIAK